MSAPTLAALVREIQETGEVPLWAAVLGDAWVAERWREDGDDGVLRMLCWQARLPVAGVPFKASVCRDPCWEQPCRGCADAIRRAVPVPPTITELSAALAARDGT